MVGSRCGRTPALAVVSPLRRSTHRLRAKPGSVVDELTPCAVDSPDGRRVPGSVLGVSTPWAVDSPDRPSAPETGLWMQNVPFVYRQPVKCTSSRHAGRARGLE